MTYYKVGNLDDRIKNADQYVARAWHAGHAPGGT